MSRRWKKDELEFLREVSRTLHSCGGLDTDTFLVALDICQDPPDPLAHESVAFLRAYLRSVPAEQIYADFGSKECN